MAVEGREGSTGKQRRTPFPEDFGERLERLLKMAELSPQELAELLGVTEPTVRRWLRGGVPKGYQLHGHHAAGARRSRGLRVDALWRRGIGERTGEIGARGRATSKRPPPPLSSSPDDALGIRPRRPAVEGAVEDPEGQADAQLRHPLGGLLLLLEEGVGDEVGHL